MVYETTRAFKEASGRGPPGRVGVHAILLRGALREAMDPKYLKLMMKRLADQGVLTRAARGTYVNPLARSLPSDIRRGLIRFLRPREISYVSLESKLSEAGAISQIATALTCMTTGASGTFETPWGIIEFTHTGRDIDIGNDVYCGDGGTLEATVRRAARDLRLVGQMSIYRFRNVGRRHRGGTAP